MIFILSQEHSNIYHGYYNLLAYLPENYIKQNIVVYLFLPLSYDVTSRGDIMSFIKLMNK